MSQPGCATVATSSSSRSVPAIPEPKRSSFRRQKGSSLRQVVYRHTVVPPVLRISGRQSRPEIVGPPAIVGPTPREKEIEFP
jgi:hypothetical protein